MSGSDQSVVIVHPESQVRQAIRQACDTVHLRTASYKAADEFLAQPLPACAGCLVLGLHIPGLNAAELLGELMRRDWVRPAIVVTAYADTRSVVSVMRAGVLDVFDLPLAPLPLLNSIHRALRANQVILKARSHYKHITQSLQRLSQREREVLDRLMAGQANKDIAREIDLSEKTVATHRNNILMKMGVKSLVEAARLLEPVTAAPQIFLNPMCIDPIDVLSVLIDPTSDTMRG